MRGCDLSSKAAKTGSPGQEETRPDAGASPSQAWVRSHNHTHKPCYRRERKANLAENFRGSAIATSVLPVKGRPGLRCVPSIFHSPPVRLTSSALEPRQLA